MRNRKARGEPLDDEWNFVAVFTNFFLTERAKYASERLDIMYCIVSFVVNMIRSMSRLLLNDLFYQSFSTIPISCEIY